MKNLLLLAILLLGIASCTPLKYVIIDPKDSTKMVEVRKRIIYDDYYMQSPIFFNYWNAPLWYRTPIIIQRPIRIPQKPQQPNWHRPIPPRAPRNR
jgi:hypothetical protein